MTEVAYRKHSHPVVRVGAGNEPTPSVRVLVLEQHQPSALGYFVVLNRQPFIERCLLAPDREEALRLAQVHRPEVAIVELDPFTGSTIGSLREVRPSMQLVISTRCETSALAARQLGAAATLPVGATAPQIVDAVRAAVDGAPSVPDIATATNEDRAGWDFNERERAVLALLVTGATNREIAGELHLSLDSIKKYTTRIYRKLGVRNRVEVVRRVDEMALSNHQVASAPV